MLILYNDVMYIYMYIYIHIVAKNRHNVEPTKIGHEAAKTNSFFCVYFRTRIPCLLDATSLPVTAPCFF